MIHFEYSYIMLTKYGELIVLASVIVPDVDENLGFSGLYSKGLSEKNPDEYDGYFTKTKVFGLY